MLEIAIASIVTLLTFITGMAVGATAQQKLSHDTWKSLYQAYREARNETLRLERKIATGNTFKRNVIRSIKKISD
jgi:hypothetical protein